jgi:hypothetical protein
MFLPSFRVTALRTRGEKFVQQAARFGGEPVPEDEIRTAQPRARHSLFETPAPDVGVVPGQ